MAEKEDMRAHMDRMGVFIKNRQEFPPEELLKYADHWVAWSPDGTSIVASSRDPDVDLDELIRTAGYDPSLCVHGFIPDADYGNVGGLW